MIIKIKNHIRFNCLLTKNTATYFDSVGFENILQETLTKIRNETLTQKIFRIQFYDSIMYDLFCTDFVECMFIGCY